MRWIVSPRKPRSMTMTFFAESVSWAKEEGMTRRGSGAFERGCPMSEADTNLGSLGFIWVFLWWS